MNTSLTLGVDNSTSPRPAISMEKDSSRKVSFFEFWPNWVMYMPVAFQWLFLSCQYRSLTVPFLANPDLTLSGMVGVPKSELMSQATGLCKDAILPWVAFEVDESSPQEQAARWVTKAKESNIHLPFVCKPDIGCRGAGVKLVKNNEQIANIIASYPKGASLLCQKLASYEPEVGIFYVKDPTSDKAEVVSMTSKFLPTIIGDGVHTLGALIAKDGRAGKLMHLYYERHKSAWHSVPTKGEPVQLVFSASHSKGAIFCDACDHITPKLSQAVVNIMDDLPNFYYGRLDVKYEDLASLQQGKTLEIIEINAASSESTHIWDKNAKLTDALKTLLWQYRTLFRIGAYHRSQGRKTPSVMKFFRHWMKERSLSKHHPNTD